MPVRHPRAHRSRGQTCSTCGLRGRAMSTSTMMDLVTSRRNFLAGGGALVVSFMAADPVGLALAADATATKTVAADEVDSFLAIDANGAVTVYSGKVDLGTGVRTGMAQLV